MLFDVNQEIFTNEQQKKVWETGIQIIPLEISLEDIEDPETVEGCTQIYNCIAEILTDMYNAPDSYGNVNVNEYICRCFDWMRFRSGNGHSDKNSTVWSLYGELRKEKLDFYISVFDKLSGFGFKFSAGEYEKSERKGFINVSSENPFILSNDKYPLFLKYWAVFREAFAKKKKFGPQLCFLDFRLLASRYKCKTDDILRPLSDKYRRYFKELYEYALSKGAKQEVASSNVIRYSYKKLYILVLKNNPPMIEVPYRLSNGGHIADEFERFLEQAETEIDSDSLVMYIQRNIAICHGCRNRGEGRKPISERCGRWVQIRDKKRYATMCHAAISKLHHNCNRFRVYDEHDIVMLKRMIDIRIAQIDDYLEGK